MEKEVSPAVRSSQEVDVAFSSDSSVSHSSNSYNYLDEESSPPSKSRFLRGVILSLFILFLGVVAVRFLGKFKTVPKKKIMKAAILKVDVLKIEKKMTLLTLKGFGTSQAHKSIEVVPEVSGKVLYTMKPFKPGAYAAKGSLLFRVDSRSYQLQYDRLQAQLNSLQQQIKIAENASQLVKKDLSRNQQLFKKSAIAKGSLERVEQKFLDRTQQLESLKQSLRAVQLQLQEAKLLLSRTRVRAPFHARISQGGLDKGAFVAAGRAIAVLESTDAIDIPVAFPLRSVQSIKDEKGTSLSFEDIPKYLEKLPPATITVGKQEQTTWTGRVIRTGARLNLKTRTIDLWIRVSKKDRQAEGLIPGLFCRVHIPIRQIPDAISIPEQALYGNKVFVVKDGKLKAQEVKVGHQLGGQLLIKEGLSPGDLVVSNNLSDPIEGTPVVHSDPSLTTKEK